MTPKSKYRYGWKALGNGGCTYHNGTEFRYNLPRTDQHWSDWTYAPNPPKGVDGLECGAGGLHLHKRPSFAYAPPYARLYLARYFLKDILGEGDNKVRVRQVQLLHIPRKKWLRLIKLGRQSNLTYADLTYANLRGADLRGADLTNANLRGADLTYANLTNANLRGADLTYANLTYADLRGANLTNANLRGADLRGANLTYADLTNADLTNADLPNGCKWTSDIDITKFTGDNS